MNHWKCFLQTMDSIISKVIDPADRDFSGIKNWNDFLNKVNDLSKKGSGNGNSNEISVLSWRKFKRVVNKAIGRDKMFAPRYVPRNHECRLEEELKNISARSISVIDIAKLSTDKQAFVFGDVLKTIYKLKLGEYDNEGINPPSRIVIFVDEIRDPEYFRNRDYLGVHWNKKFIRAIQAIINATKGKIGRGRSFFEEAFGKNLDEFHDLLWMPEAMIIYRFKYKDNLAKEWRKAFRTLNESWEAHLAMCS